METWTITIQTLKNNNRINAITEGLENHQHPNFRLTLPMSRTKIEYILKKLAKRVENGEIFNNGEFVDGIFRDCLVRLDMESTKEPLLRIIIPDDNNLFPEDEGCDSTYKLQIEKLDI